MVRIDLITGFLGSGKTTFLQKYAQYLKENGERICILENDYGAVNVDMMLLSHLEDENCGLEMVAGGCDYDCHKRRFKTKLIAMGMQGYDRVLVEPSGIFDIDEFFDVLYEEPLDRWYEIGNVITIVDAGFEEDLSQHSDFLLASQAADAGILLLSKSQLVTDEEIERTKVHINRALAKAGCKRQLCGEFMDKCWDHLTDEDFRRISSCGYVHSSYEKLPIHDANGYQSLYYMNVHLPFGELKKRVERLLWDRECGSVLRVKGFSRTESGGWLEINATRHSMTMESISQGQEIIIVIGEYLRQDQINRYFEP